MARTKQTARKWNGNSSYRRQLPSKQTLKTSSVGLNKWQAKLHKLPVWVQSWASTAFASVSSKWPSPSSALEVWRFVYKLSKKHVEGELQLCENLSKVLACMSVLDMSSMSTVEQLVAAVEACPPGLGELVASREHRATGLAYVEYGSVGFAEKLKHALRTFGYCKVTGVVSGDKAASLRAEMLAWQASLPDGTKVPPHGIYKHHYVGHQNFAWGARGEPGVRQTFAALWGVEDWQRGMITSLDGSCIVPAEFSRRDRSWPHVDQAPTSHGFQCAQGILSLTTNKRRTLVVYPFTHKAHKAYFASRNLGSVSKKFVPIDQGDMRSVAHLRTPVPVSAGDMVLWDSRLIHENEVGGLPSEDRCVQYVCMLPRSHPGNTDAQRRKRLECVQQRRTTSHWPVGITKNGMQPQVYGDKSKLIDYGGAVQPPVFSTRTLDIISELV